MQRNGYGPVEPRTISGVVAGRGAVIRGRRGYWVAERALVVAFFEDEHPTPLEEISEGSGIYLPTKVEAAEVYGVPMIPFFEYEAFCEELDLVVWNGR